MSSLAQSILTIAQSLPEGGLLSPKEYLHLGSRAAVDQTSSRLSRADQTGPSYRNEWLEKSGQVRGTKKNGSCTTTAASRSRGLSHFIRLSTRK